MTEPEVDEDRERRSLQHWTAHVVRRSEWSEPLAAVLTLKIAAGLGDAGTALAALDSALEMLGGMRPRMAAVAEAQAARRADAGAARRGRGRG